MRSTSVKNLIVVSTAVAVALTGACSEPAEIETAEDTAPIETWPQDEEGAQPYSNGRIYTQDPDLPWAEPLVTRGDRIVFVGSTEGALQYAAEDARLVDIKNRATCRPRELAWTG